MPRRLLFRYAAAVFLGLTCAPASSFGRAMTCHAPRVVLWAWERPEHLSFIDTATVGVAYLAETVRLHADAVERVPRRNPLTGVAGAHLVAVVRLENARRERPRLSDAQREQVVDAVVEVGSRPGLCALQIDFDATTSQREFYRRLLHEVRARLPLDRPLSITALASWCLDDRWIAGLPVDESVPMLFEMGPEGPAIVRALRSGRRGLSRQCSGTLGTSLEEPLPFALPVHTTYVFSRAPWSEERLRRIEGERR